MISHGYAKDYKQAAELAKCRFRYGYGIHAYIAHLTTLVKEGKVKEAT
jgi:hypothetical protein